MQLFVTLCMTVKQSLKNNFRDILQLQKKRGWELKNFRNYIPDEVHSQSKNFMIAGKETKITGDFILITCATLTINEVISITDFHLDTKVKFKKKTLY